MQKMRERHSQSETRAAVVSPEQQNLTVALWIATVPPLPLGTITCSSPFADRVYFWSSAAIIHGLLMHCGYTANTHRSALPDIWQLSGIWPLLRSGPGSVGRFHCTLQCPHAATRMDPPDPDTDTLLLPGLQTFSSDSVCKRITS